MPRKLWYTKIAKPLWKRRKREKTARQKLSIFAETYGVSNRGNWRIVFDKVIKIFAQIKKKYQAQGANACFGKTFQMYKCQTDCFLYPECEKFYKDIQELARIKRDSIIRDKSKLTRKE